MGRIRVEESIFVLIERWIRPLYGFFLYLLFSFFLSFFVFLFYFISSDRSVTRNGTERNGPDWIGLELTGPDRIEPASQSVS